jgi:hypothetical protein
MPRPPSPSKDGESLYKLVYNMDMKYLFKLAIIGNIAYILWITYNGIDDGFSGSAVQIVSYCGIILLLILNSILLVTKNKK